MTTVTIFKSDNSYKGFSCKGHAGYAKAGSDIVCAAVSVLVINTINAIEKLAGEKIDVRTDDGVIECSFPNGTNDSTRLLLDTMAMGLEDIERNYGKHKNRYFKLIVEEV